MSNPYYDETLTDHIVFFDKPIWLTGWEWLKEYKGLSGIYNPELLKPGYTLDTKLPFVYRAKTYDDDRPLWDKAHKDHLQMIGGMGKYFML